MTSRACWVTIDVDLGYTYNSGFGRNILAIFSTRPYRDTFSIVALLTWAQVTAAGFSILPERYPRSGRLKASTSPASNFRLNRTCLVMSHSVFRTPSNQLQLSLKSDLTLFMSGHLPLASNTGARTHWSVTFFDWSSPVVICVGMSLMLARLLLMLLLLTLWRWKQMRSSRSSTASLRSSP